jgi:TRAP-type C4-dicarboxylate transport system permease large subunit
VLIVIGSVASVSIAGLFTAGLLPGLFLAFVLALMARRGAGWGDAATAERASGRVVWHSFVVAIPALLLPFLIRSAVVGGIATATEVSTIGVAYTIVIGLVVYRQFDWRRIYPMLVDTATLSGAILPTAGGATAMAWALTKSGFSNALVAFMSGLFGGRWSFLAISILVFAVLGSVLEGIPAMAVRPAAVPGSAPAWSQRTALCGGGDPGDGHRAVRSAVRARLLRRLHHWPGVAGGRPAADLAILGAPAVGVVIIALIPWLLTGLVPAP